MPIQAQLMLAMAGGVDDSGQTLLIGLGWSVRPPDPQPMAVYALIYIPRNQAGRHHWRLQMTYADGNAFRLARSVPGVPRDFIFENKADVYGLDDPGLTIPLTTGPLISLPPFPLPKAREYLWRLWVDGETRDEWTISFRTSPPVALQHTGPRLRRLA
jgi:hypothetical protein